MGFKQCKNGHYYDQDLPACPYCSPVSTGINRSPESNLSWGIDSIDIKTGNPIHDRRDSGGTGSPDRDIFSDSYSPESREPQISGNHDGRTRKPEEEGGGKTTFINPRRSRTPGSGANSDNVAAPGDDAPEMLVVGWLVGVEGVYMGKSFELHHGYNYVGRETGDIVLDKDNRISREKNFYVMYSEKNKRFKIGAGQSTNILYLNDDELDAGSNAVLKAYDLIEIGNSKFRFMPFCGEQFDW